MRDGDLSPKRPAIVIHRKAEWWRKGYRESRASQVGCMTWARESATHRRVQRTLAKWRPDGKGFYFVSARGGSFNLWECDLAAGKTNQLTRFDNDSVAFPCVSRDGRSLVFRHLFDLYRLHPGKDEPPVRLEIWDDSDSDKSPIERRSLAQAAEVAFSDDGLEVAFIAGGDLWVVDTELREPRQITNAWEERDPVFAPDGNAILFTSDQEASATLAGAAGTPGTILVAE